MTWLKVSPRRVDMKCSKFDRKRSITWRCRNPHLLCGLCRRKTVWTSRSPTASWSCSARRSPAFAARSPTSCFEFWHPAWRLDPCSHVPGWSCVSWHCYWQRIRCHWRTWWSLRPRPAGRSLFSGDVETTSSSSRLLTLSTIWVGAIFTSVMYCELFWQKTSNFIRNLVTETFRTKTGWRNKKIHFFSVSGHSSKRRDKMVWKLLHYF